MLSTNIDSLAKVYPNCGLASSLGLSAQTDDAYHFDAAGMRELGRRSALAFLSHAGATYVARKEITAVNELKPLIMAFVKAAGSRAGESTLYSLDGKFLTTISSPDNLKAWSAKRPGNVYIVKLKIDNNKRLIVFP